MAKRDRVKVLLAAVNTGVYGADATPTAPIRAYDFNVQPMEATRIDDPVVQPYLGAGDTLLVGLHARMSFSVRLAGAGTAGDVPPLGALLRLCGLSETVTAGESVVYEPISTGFEDGTLYYWRDGKKRALVGCRGTVSAVVDERSVPSLQFEITGIYAAPEDVPTPAVVWTGWQTPVPSTKTSTTHFSLFGYSSILSRMTLRLGHQVEHVMRVNDERVDITGRDAGGEMTIEEPPTLAAVDYEAAARLHTRGLLRITHGTVAGNIIELSAPAAQVVGVSEGEAQGCAMQTLTLSLKPVAGDDEFVLTFK